MKRSVSRSQNDQYPHNGSAVLQRRRFADVQELRFQPAKLSDVGCAELKGGLFADCQEWRFQAAKLSDMSSAILQ